jgi:glycerol kinase
MSRYVLALDQGTTSSRAIVFGRDGRVVAMAQEEFPQILPAPGIVEHDPEAIWASQLSVAQQALAKASASAADIAAIGVTNQRETTILWDRATGRPIANAIVWQSRVSADICERLKAEGLEQTFRDKTGLVVDAYFSGTKIKHLLDSDPGLRRRAEQGEILFGTVDTFLIWRLTAGRRHVTDVSNASRTLMMDLETLAWDDEILGILGVPAAMLPEIRASSEVYGEAIGDLAGTPVAGDLGDQQAALFGQTCFSAGEAKNTYGTGCFMLMNTGTKVVPSASGLLTTLGYKIGDQPAVYALEGSIAITGALVQWLRDNLGMITSSPEVEALATTVDDNGGVYFVPAFSGLFAPYWRSEARGVIAGLTRYVNKGHIARAVLEATAWQTREVLDAMEADSGVKLKELKVDGGMVYNDLLMQFQADCLQVPVIRPKVAETTALGAAYAAGLAVGFWKNVDDLRSNWGKDAEWKPKMDSATVAKEYAQWKKAVTKTFDWVD